MDLYPAVDVAGGRVARAPAGADVPLAVARAFAAAGARWLHYVDMDRAYRRGANPAVTREILGAGIASIQVGGGLASEPDVREVLSWGAARVILGAAPALDAPAVERIVRAVGAERLGVALDVADGRLAPRGAAAAGANVSPLELARRLRTQGIRTVVYTDVPRDGALAGADLAGATRVAELGLDVIVSGGIAGLDEVTRAREAGLAGVVIGRALYEGRFTLAEALQCAA
ncbi:MAG TPA: HisA/HisF-related TIM barrel protein [Gemmatimonadales bacterium]|jgi:phosphoribosylformimino-5-aminoimidazole carboxamide ribonucleotide (ProFAR) isomerase|nr:HisA/HisF-related TIM barrel protein [Gemmatimonadales bacterium]